VRHRNQPHDNRDAFPIAWPRSAQHAGPRICIPMLDIRQKIAIGGSRIDASQHRRGTLEYFVMRATTNCKVILGTIDGARLPGRGLEPVMDRADADGDVEQIAQQLSYASVRTVGAMWETG